MSADPLERAVKGAPPPDVSVPQVAAAAASRSSSPERSAAEIHESKKPSLHVSASDPLSTLPSSPPQIYLNLLILEASLRAQYLTLQARRRQHTFFLIVLAAWNAYFLYALFFRPREDGKGVGGSPYWVVDMGEKVAFMGGIVTAVLIWGTGQWERGVRWPRRWVGVTNRGLRGMNLKIVKIRGAWWKRMLSWTSVLFPYSSFARYQGSSYHFVEQPEKRAAVNSRSLYRENGNATGPKEEDIAPGGDHIKLLLLPKQFSPEFRENWEHYRSEYWERENERRSELRKIVKKRQKELAKQQGGLARWFIWAGFHDIKAYDPKAKDAEKTLHHRTHTLRQNKEGRRRRGSTSHSRSSSRSSTTATPDFEEQGHVTRRQRSSTRQSKAPQRLTAADTFHEDGHHQMLNKRASTLSNASSSTSEGDDSEMSNASPRYAKKPENQPNVRTRQRSDLSDTGGDA